MDTIEESWKAVLQKVNLEDLEKKIEQEYDTTNIDEWISKVTVKQLSSFQKTEAISMELNNMNILNLEGSANCRDLGHTITKYGEVKNKKIIRSSQLCNLSSNDIMHLEAYGVKKVIDLRGIREREKAPDIKIESVINIHIPIFEDLKIPVLNDWYIKKKFF